MLHDRIQRAVLQQRVDRLPVALPIRERARGNLAVVKMTVIDVVCAVVVAVCMIVCGVIVTVCLCFCPRQRGAQNQGPKGGCGDVR